MSVEGTVSEHPPVAASERVSWALFDFANSPFATLMITVFYGKFFQEHIVPAHLRHRAHTLWAITVSSAMALVALSSPVVGAIADRSGRKRPLLWGYVAVCAIATVVTGLVPLGSTAGMILAMSAMVVANAAFEGGYVFYNAYLPELADKNEAGKLSGSAWALGYVGGLSVLGLVLVFSLMPESDGAHRVTAVVSDRWRWIPALVAIWYVLFSLPLLLHVRERAPRHGAPPDGWIRGGFRGVRETVRALRGYPDLVKFLVAYLVFTDALETVLVFTATFSSEVLHFTNDDNAKLFLVLNVCAIPGALVFGRLVDRWGGVKSVATTLVIWLMVVAGSVLVQTKAQFLAVGVLAALGVGGTQAASRAVVSKFVPQSESARVFGFMTLAGRASAVFGPLVYGLVADATGSIRAAVGTVSLFFIAGLLLLARVNAPRALARVEEVERAQREA
ncbi:MAG: MFS transporter [Deltaproteobacteria bacterium]|nr:MFS transporter [Deltaproteobacteria bacterium]